MGEMSTFSSSNSSIVTIWDMYMRAAKYMYGDDIEVIKTADITNRLNTLFFTVSVQNSDQQVAQRTRTTADITCKEYINNSDNEVDETLVRVRKNYSAENQYQFIPSNGVNWGMGDNMGATVMKLAMSGGFVLVSGAMNRGYQDNYQAGLNFSYEHEEKIQIPPRSKVKVKITTNVIKYEQGYTLRFSVPANYTFPVTYQTCYDRMCCLSCFCFSKGTITASQLLQTLPSFQEYNGIAQFYQHGLLSWLGEEKNVQKDTEQMRATDLLQ